MRKAGLRLVVIAGLIVIAAADRADAQSRPPAIVEVSLGWAGFVDENWIDRTAIAVGGRVFVSERLAAGPKIEWMRGSDGGHDWTLTGTAAYDLVTEAGAPRRNVVPYLIASGGYLRQTTWVGTGRYTSGELTFSGGAGVRLGLNDRWFIAPEVHVGYEPELRALVNLGIRGGK